MCTKQPLGVGSGLARIPSRSFLGQLPVEFPGHDGVAGQLLRADGEPQQVALSSQLTAISSQSWKLEAGNWKLVA